MKDFSGQNLRGRNFKGQDLTGADFSGADIRGANFTNAILKGANFTEAQAGLSKQSLVCQLILTLFLSIIVGCLQVYFSSFLLAYYFQPRYIQQIGIADGIIVILAYLAIIGAIFYGFTLKTVTILVVSFIIAIAGIAAVSIAYAGSLFVANPGSGSGAGAIAIVGIVVITVIVASSLFVINSDSIIAIIVAIIATFPAFSIATFVDGYVAYVAYVVISTTVLLSIYVSWRVLKHDKKFTVIRNIVIAFAVLGGTSFQGANLTGANFTRAILKSANFASSRTQQTILEQACWKDAKKLDFAQVAASILAARNVRELLITGNGIDENFERANLRGANLKGAQLSGAILKHADLGEAILVNADLQNANLTEAQAIGTDFTAAYLTGACLEAWNIDRSTTFKDVNCDFIFLREHPDQKGSRDRRPHDVDRTFAPGDFEKLYQEAINIIEILLKDGMKNREAFQQALATLMQAHPEITPESIQKIERKGDDALVTFELPKDVEVDKGAIERELQQAYEEVRQLRGKVDELQSLRAADAKEIALAALKQQNIFTQIAGDQTMTDSSKTNNFNAPVTAGAIGDNAQVSNNTFNQINNANTTELLQLITKLRETITTFPEDTQDAILIDLEDIEAEIQKPEETRNPKKIRQRLMAILAAAGVAASGVAGVTDFANTAIDLGNKLGIELQLPGTP